MARDHQITANAVACGLARLQGPGDCADWSSPSQRNAAPTNLQNGGGNNSPDGSASNDDKEGQNQRSGNADDTAHESGDASDLKTSGSSDDDDEIRRLAKLSMIDYDRERKDAAERLNCASTLDRLVAAERENFEDDNKQGRAVILPDPEPWSEPIEGAELLSAISANIRRHVIMSDHAADAAALWVVHTYLLDCFGISPRLALRP